MPIQNRNLEPGTKLVANYKKETFQALVIAGEDGKVRYTLTPYDGKEYKSPSSLGTAVTGKACNGWAFWSVDTEQESELGAETEPAAEEMSGEDVSEPSQQGLEPVTSRFRRVPNQRGVDEGQVRLYCDTCRNSFIVPQNKNPETCPNGPLARRRSNWRAYLEPIQ